MPNLRKRLAARRYSSRSIQSRHAVLASQERVWLVNLAPDDTGASTIKVCARTEQEACRIAEFEFAPCIALSASAA